MKIEITKQARRDLQEVDKRQKSKVWDAIYKLENEKVALGKLKGQINSWRIKSGDYRIMVEFDKAENTIYIRRVILRKDAY